MLFPADATEIGEGRSPEGNANCPFYIRTSTLNEVYEVGPAWKYNSIKLIAEAVNKPIRIYGGLGRDEAEEACCYLFKPSYFIEADGTETAAREGYYFVVYAAPMSGGVVVWDWAWRPQDQENPEHPKGYSSFQKVPLWPPPSQSS